MKKIISFIMSVFVAVFSVGCERKPDKYPDFTVEFLDVGKADCMIMYTENSIVIIDCGEKGDGKKILELLEEKGIESVDYLIITHYDKDHVGGAAKVINNIEVKNVLAPDYEENSDEVDKYNKALESKNITPVRITDDISFTLDNVQYTVYAPKGTYDNDNDFSLVTKAVYHDTSFLFTGDAMYKRLDEIMDTGKCTLLKIPYHARKIENLGDFLNNVKPQYAVACTSEKEFSDDTKKLLEKFNIKYYATCFNGDIKAVSDGNKINISSEK
ncbi:MAG: MBL fold metallo-hydrolase [Ruminococcus sp.]|nr:MBL fold metallo-hydrolase [Ruminococcus sp.]MDE6848271.1 MBL fold metallo-hydrolase [Ruminococcus sp.]MDE7138835.1 MBL fold metallo-hydrolase [Ruminococcus sp.]